MFKKLRRYRTHGRTTHGKFDHNDTRQTSSRPTELMVSAFDQPPEYPSALRLDFGDKDYDGGWIKLPKTTLEQISALLTGVTDTQILVCRHEGVCIDVQPNPDHQHGSRDVRQVVLEIERINRQSGPPGCELTLGLHEAAGANILLTSGQTQDFLGVLKNRRQTDFKNLTDGVRPTIINPDGTEP